MKPTAAQRFRFTLTGALLALSSLAGAQSTPATLASAPWEETVTLEKLIRHLKKFQEHADASQGDFPGTRFTGSEGLEASDNYVIRTLEAAGYHPYVEWVPFDVSFVTDPLFAQTAPETKPFVENVDYTPIVGTGGADITAEVSLPSGDANGCTATDFKNFPPQHVAVVVRGTCSARDKVLNAIEANAAGVILVNDSPGTLYTSLGAPLPSVTTPAILITETAGNALLDSVRQGLRPMVHVNFQMTRKIGFTRNVFAELPGRDKAHVVMAGAHLDSSSGSAGINDNGTAAAALLESALQLATLKPENTLRFAWWTGEELGLEGSRYYVEHLRAEEKEQIAVYLNYEILGAPNGARLIMGADDQNDPKGSERIVQTYVDYFNAHGLKSLVIPPSMARAAARSDMMPFMQAGIPSGFIVSGAEVVWNSILQAVFTDLPDRQQGVPTHPCYHKTCDTLTLDEATMKDPNVDFDLYLQMSRAMMHAIVTYAMNKDWP